MYAGAKAVGRRQIAGDGAAVIIDDDTEPSLLPVRHPDGHPNVER